jgi:gliding motility-associated-like protein
LPDGTATVSASGGSGGYSYLWADGQNTATAVNLIPGNYCVTVTDANSCTQTACVTVPNASGVVASMSAQTPATCNAVCDGTATVAGAGGIAPYTFSWSTSPVQTTATAINLCAGTYTVTVTDASGCSDIATVTITEPTVVVIAPISNVTICSAGTATLTASASGGNGGAYTYSWTPAGTGSTASVTVAPASTTVYTVNSSDASGCAAAPVSVTVTVNPALSVTTAGSSSVCPGTTSSFSATAANGNGGPYFYSWTPAVTGTGGNVSATPSVTTTYTVIVSDGCSPDVIDSVTITVLPVPAVVFNSNVTSGCAPVCVNFNDLSTISSGSISGWAWNFGDGTSTSQNPTHCYSTPGVYTVSLVATSAVGCSSTLTIPNMITVNSVPVASFTAPLSSSILNPAITFSDNSSPTVSSWLWNFGDSLATTTSNTSTLQNPTHVYSEVGNYCITLMVSTSAGCTDQTTLCISIDPEFTFFVPNGFSPNGDGINDEFYGKGENIQKFEMFIFDRWGNMIFFSDDISKHWNGTANHGSEVALQDVYVYNIKITDMNNKQHKYIGTVTIIK